MVSKSSTPVAANGNGGTAPSAQSKQATKPDIKFREPLTWDLCYWFLGRTAFHPLALLVYPLLVYWVDRRAALNPSAYPPASYSHLRSLLSVSSTNAYRWIGRAFWFALFKNGNRFLSRFVRNHGNWRPDRPDWRKDGVVVTGGSAGIGKAIVEVLAHEKRAKVAVLDMAPPTYAPAPPGVPEILYFKTDVSDPEQVKKAAEEIRKVHGNPALLVNCAGIAAGSTILDSNVDSITRVFKVNTLANWVTAQEFLPFMIKHNHGHVLTVASSASYMSLPQMSEYTTSKSAALAFHEVLSGELNSRYKARKVRTSVCAPTKVRTAMGDAMEDHGLPFFTPNLMPIQVGRAIVDCLDSGLSQYVIMPEFARMLPWMRAVPDWMKRIVQLVGDTDNQVTTKSITRAIGNGYGGNWEGESKQARTDMLKKMGLDK